MGVKLFDRKFGKEYEEGLPTSPGVYMFRDEHGKVLYVGKAKNLRRRLGNYRNASRRKAHRKMRTLVRRAAALDIVPTDSERAALLRENELIRTLRPPFNVNGAFSFLYPAIGVGTDAGRKLYCFTTAPASWSELDLQWYGTFRSRPRAREAFDTLVETLTYLAHPEPRSRLPKHQPIRGSRLVAFRRLDHDTDRDIEDFLAGSRTDGLGRIAERLLEKPRARAESERVQECLRCLKAFYETDLEKLRYALASAGLDGTFIDQEERDALFIATRTPLDDSSN